MPAALVLVAGCAQAPVRGTAARAAASQPLARLEPPAGGAGSKAAALAIAGEFAWQNEDAAAAARDYATAAELSRDPAVAKRGVQLALAARDAALAKSLVARWQALGASAAGLAAARGQLALLQGDRADAEREFATLLAPGQEADWRTFAGALTTARDGALAGRVLEALATPARLPASESIWVAFSQLAEHLGRHVYARELAEASVRKFNGAISIRWAAGLRVAMGDRAGALALYAKGVSSHPRDAGLRLGYATLLSESGRPGDALRILAAGPQTAASWSARVAIAARAKDDAALGRLYSELRRAPANVRLDNAFLLGQLAELLKHDREALAWYGQVDPDGDHGFDAKVRSAILLDASGDAQRAHALAVQLQQDYADDPDNLRAAYELDAQLYARRGDHAQAIAAYNRALAALPGDPVLTYDRGIEEANAGNIEAALADFRAVLKQDPGNVEAMNALGFTLADADRDLPEATELLRKALAARPDAAEILDSWGWLQYRLGHLDEAATYLRRAWNRQQDPDIGVHLAEVLWRQGEHVRARDVFATVRKLDPGNASLRKAERRLQP